MIGIFRIKKLRNEAAKDAKEAYKENSLSKSLGYKGFIPNDLKSEFDKAKNKETDIDRWESRQQMSQVSFEIKKLW